MSFRSKLFLVFLVTVLASVSVVAYSVTHYTRAAFEEIDRERTEALVAQFNKEFEQRGKDVARQVENVANGEITLRAAMDLARPNADQSLYVHDAIGVSQDHGMDFVEFVNWDGTIISSAQYPGRVGYKNDWVTARKDWRGTPAFLKREELPDGVALAVTAVRTVSGGNDKSLYIIGGWRLDQNFLAALVLPSGMRALLYKNLEPTFVSAALTDVNGTTDEPERLRTLIEQVQKKPQKTVETINWNADAASAETFHAMPMLGRNNEVLAVLLVGSSRKELVLLTQRIVTIAAIVAGAAILVGLLVSLWVAARITRPVEELAEGAREVATGRWDTRIDVRGTDEIGQLAENMQRSKQLEAKQFLEVFNESTATLKTELANLNTIVGRFSDFSQMPTPQFTKVNVNEVLRAAVRLFEAQFNAVGKPTITTELFLTEHLPEIDADADLLHKAFQNLVLNALDAMPAGGTLTLRTFERERNIRIEVADTGKGLTPEECSRLFTPYYTTKQQGTGLGLAIVQSVVSDHHGTISVTSDEGRGTSFKIELPQRQSGQRAAPAESAAAGAKNSPKTLAAASD